jgi:hypothetical protein
VQRSVRLALRRRRVRGQKVELPAESRHCGHEVKHFDKGKEQHHRSADDQCSVTVRRDNDRADEGEANTDLNDAPDVKNEAICLRSLKPEHLSYDIRPEFVHVFRDLTWRCLDQTIYLREILTRHHPSDRECAQKPCSQQKGCEPSRVHSY